MTPIETGHRPRVVTVVAVAFVLVATFAGTMNLIPQVIRSTYEQNRTIVPQGQRLTVESGPGSVTVAPSRDGMVAVRATVRYGLSRPELVESSTAAGVDLSARCTGIVDNDCVVDYVIAVPPAFGVTVVSSSGDVQVDGLAGPVRLDLESGEAALSDLAGPVIVTSDADVYGERLRSPALSVRSGSGDVRVAFTAVPASVEVQSHDGYVDVGVPGSTAYRVAAHTRDGRTVIEVPVDPLAASAIVVLSGGDGVRVHPS